VPPVRCGDAADHHRRSQEATMDQPASRLSVIVIRLSILTVRPPAAPAAWQPQLPAAPQPALVPAPRRGRRLAAAAVVVAAVLLFATVPAWVAGQVVDSGLWDLAGRITTGVARPDLSSHALPLVVGSIVVLAAMSSSSGPRNRGHW
jgi:hypothetical protein